MAQHEQEVDQELFAPVFPDHPGGRADPLLVGDQRWERADPGVERVDQKAADLLRGELLGRSAIAVCTVAVGSGAPLLPKCGRESSVGIRPLSYLSAATVNTFARRCP
jgi:hypothetical protein